MRVARCVAVLLGVGLLVAAAVLAFDAPHAPAVPVDAALPVPIQPRLAVACSSPWERWTGHIYDRPAGLTAMSPRTYEAGLLSVEADENTCLLESGDHEEMLTILALTGVGLLLGATVVRRRPGGRQRRRIQRRVRTKGTTATMTSAT